MGRVSSRKANWATALAPLGAIRMLTYVVVAVFHEEGDAVSVEVLPPRSLAQAVPGPAYVTEQLPVLEAPAGHGVYHGSGLRVVAGDGVEEG